MENPENMCVQCCLFCCPCCFPQDEKVVVCDVYQPVVPTEKKFGYPQEEVQISHPPSRKPSAVTSQPRKKTSAPTKLKAADSHVLKLPLRPYRSLSVGERKPKPKERPWRVLNSPVRSKTSAKSTPPPLAMPTQSLDIPKRSSAELLSHQAGKMLRSLSHDPKRRVSPSAVASLAPSGTHTDSPSQKGRMLRSISQASPRRTASPSSAMVSPTPTHADSPSHKMLHSISQDTVCSVSPSAAATPTGSIHTISDTESGADTPVFHWNRSKSTGAAFGFAKTHRTDLSLLVTCPTPKASFRKKASVVEFNLYYDGFRESLNIHIHRALYLPQRKALKSIDSFIQAHLEPSRKQNLKTRVIINSRSPAFDQLLDFSDLTFDEFQQQTLVLQVYYMVGTKNRFISICHTKLADLDLNTNNQLVKKMDELVELKKRATYKEIEEMLTPPKEEEALLSFTLYYDKEDHRLLVYLGCIINLPTSLPAVASNPYVQIYLLSPTHGEHKSRYASFRKGQRHTCQRSSIYTTQIVQQSHQPCYEFTACFSGVKLEELTSHDVVFRVYVNGETHFIGGVFYPVPAQHCFGDSVTTKIRRFPEEEGLKVNFLGDILLSLCHQPEADTILVTVVEVKLKKSPAHEHISPYVKVNLMCASERVSKWKTSVRRLEPNPVFAESGELDLKDCDEDEVELHVVIKKSDYLSQQTEIGLVKLGRGVGQHKTGETHWIEAMTTPNTTVTTWHPIFPQPPSQLTPTGPRRSSSQSRSRSPSPSPSRRSKVLKPIFSMQL